MKIYFFDLDGTLTDSRAGLIKCFRSALDALSIPDMDAEALAPFLGTSIPDFLRAVRPNVTEKDIAAAMKAFRQTYEREGLFDNELYPGVSEMLEAVREKGARSWVVTFKPEIYATRVVDRLGIDTHIERTIGAGLDETDTKTTLLARALAESGLAASEVLMLGDRHHDIVGALENSVRPVGALWGYGSRKELEEVGCKEFAQSPADFTRRFVLHLSSSGNDAPESSGRAVGCN